ncbi:MAG: hypothetical protein J6K82_01860 [Alphaproteobacteria bacterium]|nr:hypothetical protein [Alphaproteobacteria bacterium]
MTKSIGGYFELECGNASPYHDNAVALNSARNALRYVIRAYNIREIYAPIYTCPVVWDAILAENCKIIPYDIDNSFMPIGDIPSDAFVLYNNYFGICGTNVMKMAKKYKNLILDNAQAFYAPNCAMASIYSPRKFFGLPDGGLVLCDRRLELDFETSVSYDLCSHLLKRIDIGANGGYSDFQNNDEALIGRPIQKMSGLTHALMGNIDYEFSRRRRQENFMTLHNSLGNDNQIKINLSSDDVPMVYPYRTSDNTLRNRLIENKIFVARYWPPRGDGCMQSDAAQSMANTIIPLPIDHRYDENDMTRILSVIFGGANV